MFNRAYIEITNLCNFHCDFCPGTTRPPMAMRLSDFRTAAEKLRPLTDYLYLHVMGEPLLHPDLDKVLAICRELGFKTCITTNGLLLPKKLDILRDAPALHKLSISLHSYESNRPDVPLETYLRGCVDACDVMGQRGTVCTLRLWNKGAEPQLNGEIERILGELAGVDTRLLPRDGVGNRRLMYRTYIEEAQRFRWPGDPEYTGPDAEYCYGLRKQIAQQRVEALRGVVGDDNKADFCHREVSRFVKWNVIPPRRRGCVRGRSPTQAAGRRRTAFATQTRAGAFSPAASPTACTRSSSAAPARNSE